MHACYRNRFFLVLVLIWSLSTDIVKAEDFAAAIASGRVKVTFRGTGGSSGDSIEAIVTRTDKTAGNLELTLAPGSRLQSGNTAAQSMVIAAVKGQVMSQNSYSPSSVMEVGNTPRTYILEAYCSEFEKDNPSSTTMFSLGPVDPILACILSDASRLSTQAKQAAVWIYTDKASFSHVNAKFDVSRSDWDAAVAVVRKCSSKKEPNNAAAGAKDKPKQE